jgi:hypothetical protein
LPLAFTKRLISSVLILLRAIFFGSLFAIWFLISYLIFDLIGVGDTTTDPNGPAENVIATLANNNSTEFVKALSRLWSVSPSIIGKIDLLQRLPDGRLQLAGWALDKSKAEPLSVFLIIPTEAVLVTRTGKRRDDVWTALRLSKDFQSPGVDDVFSFKYNCKFNDLNPLVIAVNQNRQFSVIKPWIQVKGCGNRGTKGTNKLPVED